MMHPPYPGRRGPGLNPVLRPFLFLLAIGAATAHAEETNTSPAAVDDVLLDTVTVYALALDEDPALQSTPHSVLDGSDLLRQGSSTLGSSLNGLPGVHADTFGGGASRPVIRGQAAPRVSVLSDGVSLRDASAISPDHAITAEPLLVRRVEVLRGPATLLHGGGAIGGVVNVLDNRIPDTLPEKRIQGFFALRGNTVADEKAGTVSVDARLGDSLVLHAEHAQRKADDYEIAGFTTPRVNGSWSEGSTSSTGLSWVHDKGYLGIAYTWQDDEYGLPGHSHDYENCSLSGSVLNCATSGHAHAHDEVPYVDLRSKRIDIRGEYRDPVAGIEKIRLRVNRTRYEHDEIEEGQISTTFLNYGYETRIEATHAEIGNWHGVIGAQYSDAESNARGTEGFIPKTRSENIALFALEHYKLDDAWHLEAGARQEWQKLAPVNDAQNRRPASQSASSLSLAAVWQFMEDHNLSLSLARSQRLPQAQEMYADGVHLATNTYECGLWACPSLGAQADTRPETSHNVGLNLRRNAGSISYDIGVYHNRIKDYIYASTLDQIDAFRLIRYSQIDAEFTGAEATGSYRFRENWTASLFGDVVSARQVDSGDRLPRIPAGRLGTRLSHQWQSLDGEVEFYRVFAQNDIARYETRTPGHNMLNATLNYRLRGNDNSSLFLRGSNLLAEKVWNHTSFLAGVVPEPGRNLSAGIRMAF